MRRDNLTMLSDFYQLTMANGYFEHGYADKIVYFDLFFRKIPWSAAVLRSWQGWSR